MADTRAETISLVIALVCAVSGAYFDYRTRRIPNWLTASSAVTALLLHGLLGGVQATATALFAGLGAGAVFLFFYLAGGMGGGDVKLMAAVGACAGPSHVPALLIATALAGGFFAVILALAGGRLRQTLANAMRLLAHHSVSGLRPHPELNLANSRAQRLPYGVAIAAGTAMTLFSFGLGN